MLQIKARLLLYIPVNTSAAACVSATKTTVPSSHRKLQFSAAPDRVDHPAALSDLILMLSLWKQISSSFSMLFVFIILLDNLRKTQCHKGTRHQLFHFPPTNVTHFSETIPQFHPTDSWWIAAPCLYESSSPEPSSAAAMSCPSYVSPTDGHKSFQWVVKMEMVPLVWNGICCTWNLFQISLGRYGWRWVQSCVPVKSQSFSPARPASPSSLFPSHYPV